MKRLVHTYRLFLQVGVVGAIGTLVQTTLLLLFVEVLHMYPVWGNTLAAEIAILTNFTINNLWTFKSRTGKPLLVRLIIFNTGVLGSITIQAVCIWLGVHFVDARLYLLYMAIGIGFGWVVNYFFYTRLVWFAQREPVHPNTANAD